MSIEIKLALDQQWLRHPRMWFVRVVLLSIVIRFYLIFFTYGSNDVTAWAYHASHILQDGLFAYYRISWTHSAPLFNHSPFSGLFAAGVFALSKIIHVPFGTLFRLPFALLDFVACFFLYKLLNDDKDRLVYVSLYLLNPLTILFSSYHGNTDSLIGVLLIMCVYFFSNNRIILAAVMFGLGTWIKWSIVLAAPVFFFAAADNGKRLKFFTWAFGIFLLGYGIIFFRDPQILWKNIFGYGGRYFKTQMGPIWGHSIFFHYIAYYCKVMFQMQSLKWLGWIYIILVRANRFIVGAAIFVYAWLQRSQRGEKEIGRTIGEVFCIFNGLSVFWAFQYLAWALPLWPLLGKRFSLFSSIIVGGYIYAFYSFASQSLLLKTPWVLRREHFFSGGVCVLRDMSVFLLFLYALIFLAKAARGYRRKQTCNNQ
ncbi:MAG: DUF2029 domain-containing protein [Candidatus Omnitrophica bacterium]|nr:DUF2029 domain-containing protein [Candidatus Omnitrophota bacterium]MBU1925777.1 DUF2029 domain-containing protein [Candidatus Omnitrophota bacterium]